MVQEDGFSLDLSFSFVFNCKRGSHLIPSKEPLIRTFAPLAFLILDQNVTIKNELRRAKEDAFNLKNQELDSQTSFQINSGVSFPI